MFLSQIALSARKTPQAHNLASYPLIAQYGMMLLTPYQFPADSNFNDSNIALRKREDHLRPSTCVPIHYIILNLLRNLCWGESKQKFSLLLNWKYIQIYFCWVNGKRYHSLKKQTNKQLSFTGTGEASILWDQKFTYAPGAKSTALQE